MPSLFSIRCFYAFGLLTLSLLTGCSNSGPSTAAPNTSQLSVEEKIKSIEAADLPAPAKAEAIRKLREGAAKPQ